MSNPEMMKQFLEAGGEKPTTPKKPKRPPVKKYGGFKPKSDKQDARDNGWNRCLVYAHFVLQERTNARNPLGSGRPYYCEICGRHLSNDLMEALDLAQPCHLEERRHDPGQGVRFTSNGKVKRIGTDTFDNVVPGCSRCNAEQHYEERSDPMFSGGNG